jgi:hypothetical protein
VTEGAHLASYEFRRGTLAGTELSLFKSSLVHRGGDGFETIPLDRISAISVGFERDPRRMSWGFVLLIVAMLLLAAFWPSRMLIAATLAEVTAQGQAGTFLPAALRAINAFVSLLPYLSAGAALWATALLALGWIGETVLRIVIAPVERTFSTRGRDPELYEFAESVSASISRRG